MTRRTWILLVVLVLAVEVVATLWVTPRASSGPPRGASARAVEIAPSIVSVPVSLAFADLAAAIERDVPEVLAHEVGQEAQGGVLVDFDARRTGRVTVRAARDQLVVEIPVSFSARAYAAGKAQRRADKGKEPPSGVRATGQLVMRADMGFSLGSDWTLRSSTRVSHRWTETPTLAVGPIEIGIRKLADKALEPRWVEIAERIDAQRAADTGLRDGMTRTWTALGTPRQLSADPPTWLLGRPDALYATAPAVTDDALAMTFGVRGRFSVVVGDPGPAPAVAPLPPPADPPPDTGFRLAIPVALGWDTLSAGVGDALVGSTWQRAGGEVTVTGVELYPAGDRVVVAIAYEGSHLWRTSGTAFVSGVPVVRDHVASVDGLDFGVQTWDAATSTAGGLAGSTLREALASRLTFPFGEQLEAARATVSERIGTTTDRGDVVTGTVDGLDVRGVTLTDAAMVIDAIAVGSLSVALAAPERD